MHSRSSMILRLRPRTRDWRLRSFLYGCIRFSTSVDFVWKQHGWITCPYWLNYPHTYAKTQTVCERMQEADVICIKLLSLDPYNATGTSLRSTTQPLIHPQPKQFARILCEMSPLLQRIIFYSLCIPVSPVLHIQCIYVKSPDHYCTET